VASEQLRAGWKWTLSFLKPTWSLNDYPIRVREQREGSDDLPIPRYRAQVIGWWTLSGLGDTKGEAQANLSKAFDAYQSKHADLPRPGKHVPIEFAETSGIDAHRDTAARFLTEVLGFGPSDPIFISDQSSLLDFDGVIEDNLVSKVEEVFGVDVSDIEDGNLVKVFARIDDAI
jgi:hypothetical protein